MTNTFLYFAYGSNMLKKRIHIHNKTAVKKCIGQLKDYRLDFNLPSKRLGGAAATIVPCAGATVQGVIWTLHINDIASLGHQEGVHTNMYFESIVNVLSLPTGAILRCRTYQQCHMPDEMIAPTMLPAERKPSLLYLSVIINGAKENNLPDAYIEYLSTFSHNNYSNAQDAKLLGIESKTF